MADGRLIGKYSFWLLLRNSLSDLREILYECVKSDDNDS